MPLSDFTALEKLLLLPGATALPEAGPEPAAHAATPQVRAAKSTIFVTDMIQTYDYLDR